MRSHSKTFTWSLTQNRLLAVLAIVGLIAIMQQWQSGFKDKLVKKHGVTFPGHNISQVTFPGCPICELGVPMCAWMDEPLETRYPRVTGPGDKLSPSLVCILGLNDAWKKGELRYGPWGGHTLSALAKGGYHGNKDDGDFDWSLHRNIGLPATYYENFGCEPADYGNFEQDIGQYPTEMMRGTLKKPELWAPLCQCELNGIPFPCYAGDTHLSFLYIHTGPSWWMPFPSKGGKQIGYPYILQWAKPDIGHAYMVDATLEALGSLDKDQSGSIELAEFASYVRGNSKINQKWVDVQLERSPCVMIGNAWKHIDFVLKFLSLTKVDVAKATAMVGGDTESSLLSRAYAARFNATDMLLLCKTCNYWAADPQHASCRQEVQLAFRQ